MDQMRAATVFGFLGLQLDRGRGPDRWDRWRPTVALGQHEDLLVRRLELFCEDTREQNRLAAEVERDLASVSPETEVVRRRLGIRDPWDFEEVFAALHDFAADHPFDPDGEHLVHLTTGTHVAQICLFLLAESRHFPAALLETSPAGREDPAGRWQVIDLDLARYDRIAQRFARAHDVGADVLKSGIATRHPGFNAMIDRIERVAVASRSPILLTGPTGAGKSQLAARIHELRRARRLVDGPFVEVNCATLRGDQASSALFGHVEGAFTGAHRDRPGLLRAADRGVLFLDEIAELGADEQAMLLRALEERRFLPVGGDEEVGSDFQLLAGTNRDLQDLVARGRFREDLLARINLWTFRLPGLRERQEDLEPNLDYELERFAAATGQRVRFNAEARRAYLAFATGPEGWWRGNFRDLNASVTRLGTLCHGGRITAEDVALEVARLRDDWRAEPRDGDEALLTAVLGAEALADVDPFDRVQLAAVVRACRRHATLSAAGRELFAASRRRRRSTNDADRLRKYLARFGLTFQDVGGARRPVS